MTRVLIFKYPSHSYLRSQQSYDDIAVHSPISVAMVKGGTRAPPQWQLHHPLGRNTPTRRHASQPTSSPGTRKHEHHKLLPPSSQRCLRGARRLSNHSKPFIPITRHNARLLSVRHGAGRIPLRVGLQRDRSQGLVHLVQYPLSGVAALGGRRYAGVGLSAGLIYPTVSSFLDGNTSTTKAASQ